MMAQELIESKDSHIVEIPNDPFFEWYISATTDFIHKATLATVMFFVSWPWVALFWPPYYFVRRASQ